MQGGKRKRRLSLPALAVALVVAGVAVGAWSLINTGDGPAPAQAAKPTPIRAAAHAAPVAPHHAAPPRLLFPGVALAQGLRISGRAGILIDGANGQVIWQKHPHQALPVASLTKIMTAVVALEHLRPTTVVTIEPSVTRVPPFREGLRAGERVPAWKLFYGLMLYSGNDDALALALASAGTRHAFLAMMNAKARSLGLRESQFTSTSGVIDRGNHMSAWDLAALSRYAMWLPRFRAVVRTRVAHVPWPAPVNGKIYVNHNHLLGKYPGVNGIKTGWTTLSKHCLVVSARRHGVYLIAVTVGSTNADDDVKRLLDYGFSHRG